MTDRMSMTTSCVRRETVGVNRSVFSSVSITSRTVAWRNSGPSAPVMAMTSAPFSRATLRH